MCLDFLHLQHHFHTMRPLGNAVRVLSFLPEYSSHTFMCRADAATMARRESLTGRKPRADMEDPVIEDALSTHLEPLPKDVKQQVR